MIKNKYSDLKLVWFNEKMNALKDNVVTAPIYMRIKPTNRCCHKCFFCVYNYDFSKMHETTNMQDEIPIDKMNEILEDISQIGVKAITLSGGGEPLQHKNIKEILDKTVECGLDLSLLTNGQLLTDNIADKLTHAKWIRASIDYFDSTSFKNSRGCNEVAFNQLTNNIKHFSKYKENCELGVNYIITKDNYKHLDESIEFLSSLGIDNVRYSPVWTPDFYNYHENIKEEVVESLHKIRENTNITVYDSYNISADITNRSYEKCYFMQVVPVIGADLNVYNCHNKAYSNDGKIGSIKDRKFSELWYSEESKKYFETFNAKDSCNHQCANDKKNKHLHEIINCYGDNYV